MINSINPSDLASDEASQETLPREPVRQPEESNNEDDAGIDEDGLL